MGAIDAAVAAAEAPQPEPRATVQVQLRTGRKVMVNVPLDLGAQEAIDLIGFIASDLPAKLSEAGQRPRILRAPPGARVPRRI